MASIRFNSFGGIAPRTHPEKLPDGMAQTAQNCNLRRGVLEPISVTSPLTTWVEESGALKGEIPSIEIVTVTKPSAPTLCDVIVTPPVGPPLILYGVTNICQPYSWLTVTARTWATWVKAVVIGGETVQEYEVELLQEEELVPIASSFNFTEAGMTFSVELPTFTQTFAVKRGGPYRIN